MKEVSLLRTIVAVYISEGNKPNPRKLYMIEIEDIVSCKKGHWKFHKVPLSKTVKGFKIIEEIIS